MTTSCIVTPAVKHDVPFRCFTWEVLGNLTQLLPSRESKKCFRHIYLILAAASSVCRAVTVVQQGEIFQGRNTLAVGVCREEKDIFLSWSLGLHLG